MTLWGNVATLVTNEDAKGNRGTFRFIYLAFEKLSTEFYEKKEKDLGRFFNVCYILQKKKSKLQNSNTISWIISRKGKNIVRHSDNSKNGKSYSPSYQRRERVIRDVRGLPMRRIDNIHTAQEVSRNCYTIRVPTSRRTWCYVGKHVGSLSIFLSLYFSLSLAISFSHSPYTSWQCRAALTCGHGRRKAASELACEERGALSRANPSAVTLSRFREKYIFSCGRETERARARARGHTECVWASNLAFPRSLADSLVPDIVSHAAIDIYLFTMKSVEKLVDL